MAQLQTQSIPREKFLLMSANLLHKAFVEAARTDAKNIFKEIADGGAIHLTTVQMEDKSTLRIGLSLDQSEYRGKLNYGAFRASLATLIANITQTLRDQKEFPVFNADEDAAATIFGITAVTIEKELPNVMVLGSDPGSQAGSIGLRLMYLDPQQFLDQEVAETAGPAGSGEQV